MPQITNVTVTRQGANGAVWNTQFGDVFAAFTTANAGVNTQPPVGFFNNPGASYIITGTYVPTGAHYNSGVVHINIANTEPDRGVYAFS